MSGVGVGAEHGLLEPAVRACPEEGTQLACDGRIAVVDGMLRPFTPELLC